MNNIVGIVKQNNIVGILKQNKITAHLTFRVVKEGGEQYEGAYEVTPSVAADIILETENKLMSQDVTVYKIPYEAVRNIQGGETVTIGGY